MGGECGFGKSFGTAAGLGGPDALAVEDARRRLGPPALVAADPPVQRVVDPLPQATPPPAAELGGDGAPGREVVGQLPPLAACPQDVEDGVEEVPAVHGGRAADAPGLGEQGPQEVPLAVSQVTRIACTFAHTPLYGPFA